MEFFLAVPHRFVVRDASRCLFGAVEVGVASGEVDGGGALAVGSVGGFYGAEVAVRAVVGV